MAMEPPVSFDADVVRDEQAKVLKAIPVMTPEEVLLRTVRGQYGEGYEGEHKMPAYRSEPDVAPESKTETYVAAKLFIDNWRWADVPFYIRTGKRLPKRDDGNRHPVQARAISAVPSDCRRTAHAQSPGPAPAAR